MTSMFRIVLKKILPYRVYYLMFELMEDIKTLKHSIRKADRNCRNLAHAVNKEDFIRRAYACNHNVNALSAHELGIFSQNGEDGILMYIFFKIGTTNKTFVEFGVEDGRECNSANLAINHGWNGLLIDGSPVNVARGRRYYEQMLEENASNIKFIKAFVTAENINELLRDQDIRGEIDLLSIDIDGNDYWVWRAIKQVNPRVVVVEYNASLGRDSCVTIPYQPEFVWNSKRFPDLLYTGASLRLLNELAEYRNYTLIGCDTCGVNAFFVRNDVAQGRFTTIQVEEAYYPHAVRTARFGTVRQETAVEKMKFIRPNRLI